MYENQIKMCIANLKGEIVWLKISISVRLLTGTKS